MLRFSGHRCSGFRVYAALNREQERTARGEAAVKAGLQTSRLIHLLFEVSLEPTIWYFTEYVTSAGLKLDALDLKTSNAVVLSVPVTLKSVTTYVLLEQETWFEKEVAFLRRWLRPGMTAIDIGANLGVYSLLIARLVGQEGQVFAYEPGSQARDFLTRSRRLNSAINLQIFPFALSDSVREGRLIFGRSTELNALGDTGDGEAVQIVSLDSEDRARGWTSLDFVKIDAEGEEGRILSGGRNFFARHSPLVMFEIKSGNGVNERLRSIFPAMGYRLFRQLGGAPILVPDDSTTPLDEYELNLFAAKPDRMRALSERGLLVESIPAWIPGEDNAHRADLFWQRQNFSSSIDLSDRDRMSADPTYRDGLAAYAAWRAIDMPVAMRCAALSFAIVALRTACGLRPAAGRLSTWARVAWEWGAREESVSVLKRLVRQLQSGDIRIDEPFWPASQRFDSMKPQTQQAYWFAGAVAEQFEKTHSFSSQFEGLSGGVDWLCGQPFAPTEMERRRILQLARANQHPDVPARLRIPALDHLNAHIWRCGQVPGTRVDP